MATKNRTKAAVAGDKDGDDKKRLVLPVRVTVAQRQLLGEAAEKAGLDISSWLRSIGLERARKDLGRE
jgi:uncharacterized protein (DUF1778 family)